MIICFSGTGNTLRVASLLAEKTGLGIFRLERKALLHPESVRLNVAADGEKVVWAFPTYSWGVPPVVVEFIRHFEAGPSLQKTEHFMLTTCGDDMGLADRQWRALMAERGFGAVAAFSVIMPNTYVCMKGFDVDSPEVAREKLDAAAARVEDIAVAMSAGGPDMLKRGSFPWFKSKIIYPWFVRFDMSPKPFRYTEACVGCGLCARLCPMENISMTGRSGARPAPEWSDRCALCLRCYHVCPHHAVAYGHATDGKGRRWLGLDVE